MQQPKDEDALGNVNYISPAKIIEIFDGVISSENLCILSEMKVGSPSAVRKVMPQASAKQICQVVELWENRKRRRPEREVFRGRSKKRPRKPSGRRVNSNPRIPVLDQMKDVSSVARGALLDNDFPMPFPVDATQLKRLRALVQSAGVDRASVEIVSSDCESQEYVDGKIVNNNRRKEVLSDEDIFKKLKNSVAARTSLASIHAARSHKYGHHQFGQKS